MFCVLMHGLPIYQPSTLRCQYSTMKSTISCSLGFFSGSRIDISYIFERPTIHYSFFCSFASAFNGGRVTRWVGAWPKFPLPTSLSDSLLLMGNAHMTPFCRRVAMVRNNAVKNTEHVPMLAHYLLLQVECKRRPLRRPIFEDRTPDQQCIEL